MTPEEIKQARQQLKCTAKELAAALDVDAATISAWERGEMFPTKQYVDKLQGFLEKGAGSIPRKAKGADPMDALRDPDTWALIRKILAHPKLRTEVGKLAEKYEDP